MKSARLSLLTMALVTSLGFSTSALADGNQRPSSKTVLTADQEVQDVPVVSDGLATGFISFNRNFRRATVRVTFSNLEGAVTRLHLHCAPVGENGGVVLGLIDLVAIGLDNSERVTLGANSIIGTVRNADVNDAENPCNVYDLESLANAIDSNLIYWNLHTTAFPAGELRGQVNPVNAYSD